MYDSIVQKKTIYKMDDLNIDESLFLDYKLNFITKVEYDWLYSNEFITNFSINTDILKNKIIYK
jgi:hypothetical protein